MKQSIENIQKHAKYLKKLEQNEQYLFEQLNTLNNEIVEQLIESFDTGLFNSTLSD